VTDASAQPKDLRDYLRPVLKRWWLIAAVVPIVTTGTYLYYDGKPKAYTASSKLYIKPSALNQLLLGKSGAVKEVDIQNLSLLIETRGVASEVAKTLAREDSKGKDGKSARGKKKASSSSGGEAPPTGTVTATPVEGTTFILITATAPTPGGAARLANAYARTFVTLQTRQGRRETRQTIHSAESQLDRLDFSDESTRRESLEDKLQTLKLLASQPASSEGLQQIEAAVPPAAPIGDDPKGHAIFAFFVSLMLAVGGAYGLEYLNRRIRSVEDAEEVFDLPILTEVPSVDAPAPVEANSVVMAGVLHEPFRRLQMNLEMLSRERPIRTILVASAVPVEGKSVVARNLALAYREAGRNVAVLDADLRKASLGELLAARHGPGLSEILAGQASFGQVVQEVQVRASGNGNGRVRSGELAMVPAGQRHGGASLASGEMRQTLRTAADTYGTAIIDSPPLLAVPDVLPLLSEADAVVLVMRLGVTTRDSARRMLSELRRLGDVNVVGLVVNGVPSRVYRARSYGYYYG
jgi:capsular exopolysaccharide synthesis family protein